MFNVTSEYGRSVKSLGNPRGGRLAHSCREMVYGLPEKGRRLIQKVDGCRYTICSGEVTCEEGAPTGALPGKLVREPQSLPAS